MQRSLQDLCGYICFSDPWQWQNFPEKYRCWCRKLEWEWDRWAATVGRTVDETLCSSKRNVENNTHSPFNLHLSIPAVVPVHGKEILYAGGMSGDKSVQTKPAEAYYTCKRKMCYKLKLYQYNTSVANMVFGGIWVWQFVGSKLKSGNMYSSSGD